MMPVFCTKDQVKGEFQKVLQLTTMVIKKMGFDNFTAQISLRDPEKPENILDLKKTGKLPNKVS